VPPAVIPAVIAAAATIASTAISSQLLKKSKAPALPKPTPIGPTVAPDMSGKELASARPADNFSAPNFLKMSGSMTPLQKRTQFATFATQGNNSAYKDPAAKDFYKKLVTSSLIDPEGNITGDPTPIERQYVQNVLGQEIREPTTESFLSAVLRA
jgi:hypothetical protein